MCFSSSLRLNPLDGSGPSSDPVTRWRTLTLPSCSPPPGFATPADDGGDEARAGWRRVLGGHAVPVLVFGPIWRAHAVPVLVALSGGLSGVLAVQQEASHEAVFHSLRRELGQGILRTLQEKSASHHSRGVCPGAWVPCSSRGAAVHTVTGGHAVLRGPGSGQGFGFP